VTIAHILKREASDSILNREISDSTTDHLLAHPHDPVVVSGVRKRYGKTVALAGVSFRIPKGSVVSILGPNGAGKSTLLEILIGLRTPDAGEVRLFGTDILKNPRSCQHRIGVQLQDTRLVPKMTVREAFKLFAGFYEKTVDIDSVATPLGLHTCMKKRVSALSGGWRQRLALALSLINDPDLLFLDEPTTGFDPIVRREVWQILEKFRAGGRTIVLSTHYMEEAERLSDQIIMLSRGSIIAAGTASELKASLAQTNATLEDVYAELIQRDEVMQ
jgi:ABC-2 type transport system ATP-binding protein